MATKQTFVTASGKVAEDVVNFLNYATTHPNAVIQYYASAMVLRADSDASYLSVKKSRSRVGGHHYLSLPSANGTKIPVTPPLSNGPLHAVCSIMNNVMATAEEAEIGYLFVNRQEVIILKPTLKELGH